MGPLNLWVSVGPNSTNVSKYGPGFYRSMKTHFLSTSRAYASSAQTINIPTYLLTYLQIIRASMPTAVSRSTGEKRDRTSRVRAAVSKEGRQKSMKRVPGWRELTNKNRNGIDSERRPDVIHNCHSLWLTLLFLRAANYHKSVRYTVFRCLAVPIIGKSPWSIGYANAVSLCR